MELYLRAPYIFKSGCLIKPSEKQRKIHINIISPCMVSYSE
jgi:hypothetical protein